MNLLMQLWKYKNNEKGAQTVVLHIGNKNTEKPFPIHKFCTTVEIKEPSEYWSTFLKFLAKKQHSELKCFMKKLAWI